MSHDELVRRVCTTYRAQRTLSGERVEHPSATILRSPQRPEVWDANHASDVRACAPGEIEGLLAALDAAMPHTRVRRFFCDPFTPQPFVARLVVEGFAREATVQLVLEGELAVRPRALEIRRAESDADWESVAELTTLDLRESAAKAGGAPPGEAFLAQMLGMRRETSPPQHVWIARDCGEDCGCFASWPGVAGMGMVEWLFVRRPRRRRGVATALIARAVADARERGAGPVLIGASGGTDAVPRRLYASLGFRPVCVTEEYTRFVRAPYTTWAHGRAAE